MNSFLLVLLLIALTFLALKFIVSTNPRTLAVILRRIFGSALCALALVMMLSGRFILPGFFIGIMGIYILLKGRVPNLLSSGGARRASSSQSSSVTSDYFVMQLDHQTGEIDGDIIKGRFSGERLGALDHLSLKQLYEEICHDQTASADSISLLETYLDSVMARWREDFHAHMGDRQSTASGSGTITEQEAYEILGLLPGADESMIREAHRRLIAKLHPDRGGSTFLAAKINEAKDILLRSHSSPS